MTQPSDQNSKKTSVASNGTSKSKIVADSYSSSTTTYKENGKERDRREAVKVKASKMLKTALKLKEIESRKPSYNAVIAPASDMSQGFRVDAYGAVQPQRIETVTDMSAPREVKTGFKKNDNNSINSSSLAGGRDSLKDAAPLNSSSSSSRLKNPHLQEEYKALRMKEKQEKADKIKALENKEKVGHPRTIENVDTREFGYSLPNSIMIIQKEKQEKADRMKAEEANKEKAALSKAIDDAKINQKVREIKSSSNNVVMIQKFGSLNEEAYTCISQLWGGNRSLFERWRTSRTIPGLYWEYLLSADDFQSRGFSININKSNFGKIQVFDLDPVEVDTAGAALLRHIVDSSYAVFCGQTPIPTVDVVMIVNSQGLAGISICEQLHSMNIYSNAAYYLVAFSMNSLFAPKPIPEPVIVSSIIPKQISGPPGEIRGIGCYSYPQGMDRAPTHYRTATVQPLQITGMPHKPNNVENTYQMPIMPYNTQPQCQMLEMPYNTQPQCQMPRMPYNTQSQYQMPEMPYTTQSQYQMPEMPYSIQSQYQMPRMPYNAQSQYQMPVVPHHAMCVHPIPQMASQSTSPQTPSQYFSSVLNSFANSISADNFQNTFKLSQPEVVNTNVRSSLEKTEKRKKKEKERDKVKGREKERGHEKGYKRSDHAKGEGHNESKDFRGGENSSVADRKDTGRDRGKISSNHQQDHDRAATSRSFTRFHSNSRDVRPMDRGIDKVKERDSNSYKHEEYNSGRRMSDPSVSTYIPMNMDIGKVYTGDDYEMTSTASPLNGPKKRKLADVEDPEEIGNMNPYNGNKYSNAVQNDKESRKGGNKSAIGAKSSSSSSKVENGVKKHFDICHYFTKGKCDRGDKCRREHVDPKLGPRTGTVPIGTNQCTRCGSVGHHVEQCSDNHHFRSLSSAGKKW